MQRVEIRKRMQIMMIAFTLVFVSILGKLFYEQVFNHNTILKKAQNLWERDFHISGLRGSILDCNHEVLAQDIPATSLVVVPSQIEDAKKAAKAISAIIEMDEEKLYQKMIKKVSTQKIQPEGRLLSEKKAQAIANLNLKGIYLIQDSLRYYPNGKYLAQVLGFSGIDNQGLAGLELQYDEYLSAKQGSLNLGFDAKGQPIENYDEKREESGKGNDVVLTIDKNIQDIVEREMNNLVEKYAPKQALALAMNPNTGEVLAMVSKPDFDPNHYQDYDASLINRNLPIWMSYEPGSTFKSITFASALDLKLFDMMQDTYMDVGYEMVEGARIKSWKAGGHGLQTFLQVLENSSNPGFVEIARRLGLDNEYQYVTDFGFGTKTGIDLPGESTGIMFQKEKMGLVEQATVAFGQGLSVTPIQLVSAFSAIVNGGTLYRPYITKYIVNPSTEEIMLENKPVKVRQVISKKTSDQMRYALESVVANGGGKNAYIEGYKIGGKTGTAQKAVNGVYLSNEYILSMIAALPMENPQIVLYIAVDSPNNDVQYGGTVVGPIIKVCMEDMIAYLDIEASDEQIPKKTTWLDPVKYEVNHYIGMQKEEVKSEKLKIVYIGEGSKVIDQMPEAGVVLDEGKEVWVYLAD
ncbi:MAG: stage V sporulation protein D [Erysipelotrichia bacterium]|nr:stage V sporulation protein D [Erysipelotrichia bacterium]